MKYTNIKQKNYSVKHIIIITNNHKNYTIIRFKWSIQS